MSRSGLDDSSDCDDHLAYGRWRGAVASAFRGKRGQETLRELGAAMDAMECKTLTVGELEADGEYCTVGVLMQARGIDRKSFDVDDYSAIAEALGINEKIVQEIEYMNDGSYNPTRWVEVCGPPKPEYGRWYPDRTVEALVQVPDAGHRLWQTMRKFIEARILKD